MSTCEVHIFQFSDIAPPPPTPPTHWCAPLFTRVSITVTVCWPRVRSTSLTSFNRSCAPPPDWCCNSHIGHPLLIWCTNSYTGLTFKVGWGTRSAYSSTSASTGSLPGTSLTFASRCKYRPPVPPCVQPGFKSVFSLSLERKRRQLALAASSTLRPLFGTRSLMICVILNSPSAVLGTNWKLSCLQHLMHMQINFVVHLLPFNFLLIPFNVAVRAKVIFISWRV